VNEFEEPLPEWATGHTTDYRAIGAQLATRDGRRVGNAVVIECDRERDRATVVTDAGSLMTLAHDELDELFHRPRWVSYLPSHPGVIAARRIWVAENPPEEGRDHVTPFDHLMYGGPR